MKKNKWRKFYFRYIYLFWFLCYEIKWKRIETVKKSKVVQKEKRLTLCSITVVPWTTVWKCVNMFLDAMQIKVEFADSKWFKSADSKCNSKCNWLINEYWLMLFHLQLGQFVAFIMLHQMNRKKKNEMRWVSEWKRI